MKRWLAISAGTLIGICTAYSPAWAEDSAASEAELPDAMQHMVIAPDIDFEKLRDPFASYLAKASEQGKVNLVITQRRMTDRDREKLEAYDLSTLNLVAIFSMGGERVAMVQDSEAQGYVVRRGNYMGKNNGKIEKITDDTVFLVEQVLNPAGEIIDRQVSLTMKEVNEH